MTPIERIRRACSLCVNLKVSHKSFNGLHATFPCRRCFDTELKAAWALDPELIKEILVQVRKVTSGDDEFETLISEVLKK